MERRITYKIKKSLITAIDENRLDVIRSVLANYKKRKRYTSANDTSKSSQKSLRHHINVFILKKFECKKIQYIMQQDTAN
jgi:hypothetical protein